jgi:hypothetical protein
MSQSHNDRGEKSATIGKVPAHAVGQSGWWLNSLRRVAARKFSNPIIENLALFACLVAVELYILKLGLKAFILSLKVRYLVLKSRYLSFGKREAIKRKIEAFALYIRQRYFRKDLSCGIQENIVICRKILREHPQEQNFSAFHWAIAEFSCSQPACNCRIIMHHRTVRDKHVRIRIWGLATFHAAYGQHRVTPFNSTSACPLAKWCPFLAGCTPNPSSFRQSGADPTHARNRSRWI